VFYFHSVYELRFPVYPVCTLRCRRHNLSVAKNGSRLGNNGYFSANRTKVELLAVFLIMATNSIEFSAIGVFGLDK
jgi:hypothetical protein